VVVEPIADRRNERIRPALEARAAKRTRARSHRHEATDGNRGESADIDVAQPIVGLVVLERIRPDPEKVDRREVLVLDLRAQRDTAGADARPDNGGLRRAVAAG